MQARHEKIIYWTPRVLSILFLCFLAMFSLDVISPELSMGEIAVGLFMHNIPVFVLAFILAISWKREIVGGVAFLGVGLLFFVLSLVRVIMSSGEWAMLLGSLILCAPAVLIGYLFIVNWRMRKTAHRNRVRDLI